MKVWQRDPAFSPGRYLNWIFVENPCKSFSFEILNDCPFGSSVEVVVADLCCWNLSGEAEGCCSLVIGTPNWHRTKTSLCIVQRCLLQAYVAIRSRLKDGSRDINRSNEDLEYSEFACQCFMYSPHSEKNETKTTNS